MHFAITMFTSSFAVFLPWFFSSKVIPTSRCPDYTVYSTEPHGTRSSGPLQLPFMRPEPQCRTFNSSAVEVTWYPWFLYASKLISPILQKVIGDMYDRLKDPDLARLFENTFPNTLDTTVKYFDPKLNLAFIITGVSHLWPRSVLYDIY